MFTWLAKEKGKRPRNQGRRRQDKKSKQKSKAKKQGKKCKAKNARPKMQSYTLFTMFYVVFISIRKEGDRRNSFC